MSGRWGGRSSDKAGARDAGLTIFSEGYQAETRGKSLSDNPYSSGPKKAAWEKGFKQSQKETTSFEDLSKYSTKFGPHEWNK